MENVLLVWSTWKMRILEVQVYFSLYYSLFSCFRFFTFNRLNLHSSSAHQGFLFKKRKKETILFFGKHFFCDVPQKKGVINWTLPFEFQVEGYGKQCSTFNISYSNYAKK